MHWPAADLPWYINLRSDAMGSSVPSIWLYAIFLPAANHLISAGVAGIDSRQAFGTFA